MKMKRIIAGIVAGALTVSSVIFTNIAVNAADATEFGSPDGEWTQKDFVSNSSPEMVSVDLVGVDKVVLYATANDLNYGWNNGQFYSNSKVGGWKAISYGGVNNQSTYDITLEKIGPFSVEMPIAITGEDEDYWSVGWATNCNVGVFELNMIKFYKDDVFVCSWANGTVTTEDVPIDEPTESTPFGSEDGEWTQKDFVGNGSPEMDGVNLIGVDKVVLNAMALDLNYGWNNGQFYSNSKAGGWKATSYGGVNNQSTYDITLEKVGAFRVEMPIAITGVDEEYWSVGWATNCKVGCFELNSIEFFKGDKLVCTWIAGEVFIPATGVTLNKDTLALEKGDTFTLEATVDPENSTDKVVWSSDNEDVATVDENGEVTAVDGGTATITATAGDVSAECEITVTVPVTSVTLNKNELSLEKGESATLTATVIPDDADDKTVTWTSSATAVATVDENGKVTAVGGGKAVITAKAGDKSATCEVTVTVPVTGIKLDKKP
ncbi:MAG: Ig-like domain-containing protein, partial [Ruminiclostridium sp.]|nr:Ig-like domain-containing protein [Ruminiclostridium sp.]